MKQRKRQKSSTRHYQCENCGSIMPIARISAQEKEYYHPKHLYCIKCKTETKHIEQPDYAYGDLVWKCK